jgi:hypothetical protein
MLGQISKDDLDAAMRTESAHNFYQAAMRGCSRYVSNGLAKPSQIYLIFDDEQIEEVIRQAMPNIRIHEWIPNDPLLNSPSATKDAAKAIGLALVELVGLGIVNISVREFKNRYPVLKQLSNDVFREARDLALKKNPFWKLFGKSLAYSVDSQEVSTGYNAVNAAPPYVPSRIKDLLAA